jgi:zinc D-Ala-D-Ala dipeptidase
MQKVAVVFLFLTMYLCACKEDKAIEKRQDKSSNIGQKKESDKPVIKLEDKKEDSPSDDDNKSLDKKEGLKPKEIKAEAADNNFIELSNKNGGIVTDIRYATSNNFTKKQIYPCGKCYLRPLAAAKIKIAQENLKKQGLGLKMFDCYRPRPAQQRLWDAVPNPDYVTPPAKGSMHNKGLAVDLTLVDASGKELNMGTPYDFFGKEAHTDNVNLPKEILKNRNILKQAMNAVGFKGIRTEWWHFSLENQAGLSSWEWECD